MVSSEVSFPVEQYTRQSRTALLNSREIQALLGISPPLSFIVANRRKLDQSIRDFKVA